VVDIIRPESYSAEFLEQVVLFVGAFGGRKERDAFAAVLFLEFLETASREVQRLIPRCGFEIAVLPDQWGSQPFAAVDELMAVPAFDAQLALVHGVGLGWKGADELAVEDFEQ